MTGLLVKWSRCDSCGDRCPDEVGPILMGLRGWQGFHIDGVRDGDSWEGAVWICRRCAPKVAAGRAPIRTFLGGFTTEPTMAEFVAEPVALVAAAFDERQEPA